LVAVDDPGQMRRIQSERKTETVGDRETYFMVVPIGLITLPHPDGSFSHSSKSIRFLLFVTLDVLAVWLGTCILGKVGGSNAAVGI